MKTILCIGDCIANGGPGDPTKEEWMKQNLKQYGLEVNSAYKEWTKKNQWLRHMGDFKIVNRARLGETFEGMRLQYIDTLQNKNITPDLVLITDHANSHYGSYIQGQWIQREFQRLEDPPMANTKLRKELWESLYNEFMKISKWEKIQGEEYYNDKMKKQYNRLIEFCDEQDISYYVLRFRNWSKAIMPKAIDCLDLTELVEHGDTNIQHKMGKIISERIGI